MTRLLRYRHDGLTFDVRDEGPLEGDPVVLLHGFPERSSSWREVVPLLHAQGLMSHWIPTQEPQAVADAVLSRIGSNA